MQHRGRPRSQVRLAGIFLVLVLLPSFLLGYFSLRAVESERAARTGRIRESSHRYAELAAQALHQHLSQLESAWLDLVPERDWQSRPAAVVAALDTTALASRFLREAYLVQSSGEVRWSGVGGAAPRTLRGMPTPKVLDTAAFEAAVAAAETAEYEQHAPRVAMDIYARLLATLQNPQLRAIAWAERGRLALRVQDWDAALLAGERVLAEAPEAADLENQPLRFVAAMQMAAALRGRGEAAHAAALLAQAERDLQARADALGANQYGLLEARIDSSLMALQPALPDSARLALDTERAARGVRAKPPAGAAFFAAKLQRKLVRATMDGQRYSLRMRYISDVADGQPYLLAYAYLPDPSATHIDGLLGLRVDVARLSSTLLPGFLRELELSPDTWLEVVDDSGRRVIGAGAAGPEPARVQSSLASPFDFWTVVVHGGGPQAALAAVEFRTKVFLALIAVLLLTIGAGAYLVFAGLRREARLANLKTSFVSNVSHELRTPLTSIRMYAEMLEMSGSRLTEDERHAQLAVIRSECGRLERLIDAVLDFASLSRGTKKFHLEYEEVGALVHAAAEEFREQASAAGFQYDVEVESDLPELQLDADAMRQVLFNLLSNALKYSDDRRWIVVRARRQGEEVAIEVEDHGIGIAPADQQRIFEDFYRVDQRLSSARRGVGLGLTLVRRIVEAHHGRVTVESTLGRGSRFTVWLPIEAAAAGSTAPGRGPLPQEA
jgi:signal transduction histidine kinase